MTLTQKRLAISAILLMGIVAFFFLGKTRYRANPLMRLIYTKYFIEQVRQAKTIDTELFWEYRDFMAGVPARFDSKNQDNGLPFLDFNGPSVTSRDYLKKPGFSIWDDVEDRSSRQEAVFASDTEAVWSYPDAIVIKFVKSQTQMQRANGFFGYYEIDLSAYPDHIWHSTTIIKL